MKHLLRGLFLAALILCCNILPTLAQPMQPLPIDKNVRIGKLDNGLTYYIRHNALPEKRVEFHIAQKVGSILEEPNQRGLAHFLEHMAFNSTEHFPGDSLGLSMVAWCETKGIKFGYDLNAYTSIDQTVYRLSNVPTDNTNVMDTCLIILHDWSNSVLLTDREIEKERGVIREEYRSRDSGMLRLITDAMPTMYADSRYAYSMPIGTLDVINNFTPNTLRDYYAKWYRPDLQGIVIVGDIDVDQMETKLKEAFADVKAPVNPAERIYYPVSDNDEPLVYIGTDKEVETPSISFFFKTEAYPDSLKNSVDYWAVSYITNMATTMLNSRLNEIRQQANPPFTSASAGYGTYFLAKTKNAFGIDAGSKIDGIGLAMKTILEETERARRFGFTTTEYDRARANFLQGLESTYNERDKMKNDFFVNEYISNFLDNEPITGIPYYYMVMNQVAPNIPLEAINKAMEQLVTDKNQVILLTGPEKEGAIYPTKEEIVALLKQMPTFDLKPYEDKVSNEPLLKEKPAGGKIVSETTDNIYGTTKLELSNGVTVYLKPTDHKADEVLMKGVSLGGTSIFEDKDGLDASQLNNVVSIGGLGNFSLIELTKALAGKRASVSPGFGNNTETVNGNCAPKDFETMMQLTYLCFTAPRKDAEAFESHKSRLKANLHNQDANPMTAFGDSIQKAVYNNNPRILILKEDMVDNINYDHVLEMYKNRLADASDFTFYFVGNIDMEQMKPLIAKYLGSLPAINREESFIDRKIYIRPGEYTNEFAKAQETPMASILFVLSGKCEYNLRNRLTLDYLTQALNIVYNDEIREKEGGTYGVSCSGSISKHPQEQLVLQVFFQTDPAKRAHLADIVSQQLDKMAKEGPTADHMLKAKEYLHKQYANNQKENNYWLGNLDEYFYTGVDNTKGFEALVDSITAQDVQEFLDKLLKQNNEIKVIMTAPEQ